MIIGFGNDLCDIRRIEDSLARFGERFVQRCFTEAERAGHEFTRIKAAAALASGQGLECHAGHGLDFATARIVAGLPEIVELNIGHFLIGEAVFIGLNAAIAKMRAAMDEGRAKAK